MDSTLESFAAGALDEEGPASLAGALSLSFSDTIPKGVASSTVCLPLSLAEASERGAEQSGALAEGGDPKRPKSLSAGKKHVNIAYR